MDACQCARAQVQWEVLQREPPSLVVLVGFGDARIARRDFCLEEQRRPCKAVAVVVVVDVADEPDVQGAQSGLFLELPHGGVSGRFVVFYSAARKLPALRIQSMQEQDFILADSNDNRTDTPPRSTFAHFEITQTIPLAMNTTPIVIAK